MLETEVKLRLADAAAFCSQLIERGWRPADDFRVSSMNIILNSLPLLGSWPHISSVLEFALLHVSICRITLIALSFAALDRRAALTAGPSAGSSRSRKPALPPVASAASSSGAKAPGSSRGGLISSGWQPRSTFHFPQFSMGRMNWGSWLRAATRT